MDNFFINSIRNIARDTYVSFKLHNPKIVNSSVDDIITINRKSNNTGDLVIVRQKNRPPNALTEFSSSL